MTEVRAKGRVRVRSTADGTPLQEIGLAACLDLTPFVSLRVKDAEQAACGWMQLRLGRGPACALLRRLSDACRVAFGAEAATEAREPTTAEASFRPVAGRRDDKYVPGEPWRRGRWVAPLSAGGVR